MPTLPPYEDGDIDPSTGASALQNILASDRTTLANERTMRVIGPWPKPPLVTSTRRMRGSVTSAGVFANEPRTGMPVSITDERGAQHLIPGRFHRWGCRGG